MDDSISGSDDVLRQEVTQLLRSWRGGDGDALEQLMPLVYERLREQARIHMRKEPGARTLEPTALVHEVYLRLVEADVEWQDRAHFYAVAGRLMRRLLVDDARRRGRQKRGAQRPLELDAFDQPPGSTSMDKILELDHALKDLAAFDERKAKVVEARIFGGLTIEEAALVLKISESTVERELRLARAWLARELLRT